MTEEEVGAVLQPAEDDELKTATEKFEERMAAQEEDEFVAGEELPAVEPIRPDYTLDGRQIRVYGTRLLVRTIEEGEKTTPGGIIVPRYVAENRDSMMDIEDLEEAVILAVGDGRYNADKGIFHGSPFQVGEVVWIRRSAPHLHAEVPGRKNVFLIQEDLVHAVLAYPDPEEDEDHDPFRGETDEGQHPEGGEPPPAADRG